MSFSLMILNIILIMILLIYRCAYIFHVKPYNPRICYPFHLFESSFFILWSSHLDFAQFISLVSVFIIKFADVKTSVIVFSIWLLIFIYIFSQLIKILCSSTVRWFPCLPSEQSVIGKYFVFAFAQSASFLSLALVCCPGHSQQDWAAVVRKRILPFPNLNEDSFGISPLNMILVVD